MSVYLLRRIYQSIIVFFVVTIIVFIVIHYTGDPVQILMPVESTPKQIEEMRHNLGLDKPLWLQYVLFLKNALQGNLGTSFHHGQPAIKLVLERVPATLELVLVAFAMSFVLSIPTGVIAATHRGKAVDRIALVISLFGISAPIFWVGIACIYIFCVELHWLPSSGRGHWTQLILPSVSIAVYLSALYLRLIRAGMLDVMNQDYIRTARAKGLSEKVVVYKHALRNALIPFVTISGMQLGTLLAGAIVTEKVFAWPGMGRLFLDSINFMDYPVIIAWTLFTVTIFLTVNLIVDIMYVWLDPRIRHEK